MSTIELNKKAENPQEGIVVDNQINFLGIFRVILNRWRLGLIIYILILAATSIYLLLAAPTYQSTSMLKIGKITYKYGSKEADFLEEPKALVTQLNLINVTNFKSDDTKDSYSLNASINKPNKDVIKISVQSSMPEKSQQILNRLVDDVLENHQSIFLKNLKKLEEIKNHNKREIQDLVKSLMPLEEVRNASMNDNPVLAVLLGKQINDIKNTLVNLEKELLELEFAFLPPRTRPSKLLLEPTFSRTAVEPRYQLIFVSMLVLGVLVSVGLILITELFRYILKINK